MRALAVLLPCLLLTVAGAAHAQGTTRLLGRVVGLNGQPLRDVRIRIVGHGEPEVTQSGEFQLDLAGRPAQVEVAVLDSALEVLYPLRGALLVPRDPATRVPVVVGRAQRLYINDLLAARFVQLEGTLNRNGVRYDAAVDSLGDGVRRIIALLELKEADLRGSIELQKKQQDLKPLLFQTFDAYLLEAKDLRDAFRLVVPYAAQNRAALDALHLAIREYNEAFTAVNNRRNEFQTRIRDFWKGAEAEGLERDLRAVYDELIEELHKLNVLPMNESLVPIQLAHGPDPPDRKTLTAAVGAAQAAAERLDTRIGRLEEKYRALRSALERN